MVFRKSVGPTLFEPFDHASAPPDMDFNFTEAFDHAEPGAYTLNFTEAFDS